MFKSVCTTICLSVAVCLAIALQVQAAPLIHEDFNYNLNETVDGADGGSGFAAGSSWSFVDASVDGASAMAADNLTFGNLVTSGNAVSLAGDVGSDGAVRIKRDFGHEIGGGNFWMSYLIQPTDQRNPSSGNATVFGQEFRPDGGGDRKYFSWPKYSSGWSDYTANVGVNKDQHSGENFNLSAGTTYLVVAAYENIGLGNYSSETTHTTMWLLEESDFEAIQADGLTRDELDAEASVKAIRNAVEPKWGTPSVDANDTLELLANRGAATYDELRVGTEIGDVLLIPEPASLALLSLGGVMIVRRRIRKQTS